MVISQEKAGWLSAVLGVTLPSAATGQAAGNTVKFQRSRLLWEQARKNLRAELDKLQAAILDQSSDEADFGEIQTGVGSLDAILDTLDTRLTNTLDELYNAEDQTDRPRLMAKARGIIIEYSAFVAGDPLMAAIDANPFTPVKVASTATSVLKSLNQQLA